MGCLVMGLVAAGTRACRLKQLIWGLHGGLGDVVSPAEVLGCPGCLPCGYPKHLKWTRTPAFGQLNPARGGLELLIPVGLPPFS